MTILWGSWLSKTIPLILREISSHDNARCLSVYLPIYLSIYLSFYPFSIHLRSTHPSINQEIPHPAGGRGRRGASSRLAAPPISLSSIYLSIYPCICLSVYYPISIYLSIYSLSIYLTIDRSINLSIFRSIHLSIHLSVIHHLFIYYRPIHPPSKEYLVRQEVGNVEEHRLDLAPHLLHYHLSIYLFIYLSIYLAIYLAGDCYP